MGATVRLVGRFGRCWFGGPGGRWICRLCRPTAGAGAAVGRSMKGGRRCATGAAGWEMHNQEGKFQFDKLFKKQFVILTRP